MRSVTWVQSKSHPFVNTADAFRERSHTHKSMPHVRPTGIFKPELWILCLARLGVLACEAVFPSPVVLRRLAAPCVLPCSFPCF